MKNKFLAAAVVAATIATVASLLASAHVLPALAPTLLRWLAIFLIAAYATSRRSLTAWILVGLLAGAELGHDAPSLCIALDSMLERGGRGSDTSDGLRSAHGRSS